MFSLWNHSMKPPDFLLALYGVNPSSHFRSALYSALLKNQFPHISPSLNHVDCALSLPETWCSARKHQPLSLLSHALVGVGFSTLSVLDLFPPIPPFNLLPLILEGFDCLLLQEEAVSMIHKLVHTGWVWTWLVSRGLGVVRQLLWSDLSYWRDLLSLLIYRLSQVYWMMPLWSTCGFHDYKSGSSVP